MESFKLTKVSVYHYVRLVVRVLIFLVLLYHYVFHKIIEGVDVFESPMIKEIAIIVIFIMFIIEMIVQNI